MSRCCGATACECNCTIVAACVQIGAKCVLGDAPIEWPAPYLDELRLQYLCGPRAPPAYWNHEATKDCWWIDAGKHDPVAAAAKAAKGIWKRGVPRPVHEHRLVHLAPGGAPKVMFYLVGHRKHGTHVFFPRTGCRGGPAGAWRGVRWWDDDISEPLRQMIIDYHYFNFPEAVAVVDAHIKQPFYKDFYGRTYNPKYYLVRTSCAAT